MNIRNLILTLLILAAAAAAGTAQPIDPARFQRGIACIGNSITWGDGIADREHFSYPARLQQLLGPQWEVKNFGSSGRTLLTHGDYPYIHEPEFRAAKEFLPIVVLIKLGTNDTKPQNWRYRDEFAADYAALIKQFRDLASHPKIYLCTPVPAFPGNWGISDSIISRELIPMLRVLAEKEHLPLIDLYTPLKQHPEFFPDKVHPNGDGARLMAETIYERLRSDFQLVAPPAPVGPLPAVRQLMRQQVELAAFLHFGINTFTDKEWGYGDESPDLFNPSAFDADSIVGDLAGAGFKEIILTCKHHDGFCLWPTKTTKHSVQYSKWRDGKGDVVGEIAEACKKRGVKFGVYLSPWDRNAASYGTPAYLDLYRAQLKELLTSYGPIAEVWFDGANGGDGYYGGAKETRTIDRRTYYDWPTTWKIVRKLQPDAVMFSDVGPDLRWVGNEDGSAGDTCWSPYTPIGEKGDAPAPGYVRSELGITGQSDGKQWMPAECDVSIRPGWFYHPAEDSLVKTPKQLFDLYCRSVGRNGLFLLNVPPDRSGRLHAQDVEALGGLKRILNSTFARNAAADAEVIASNSRGGDARYRPANAIGADSSSYWSTDDSAVTATLTLGWHSPVTGSLLSLGEDLSMGQRVESFMIDAHAGGTWKHIASASTIGQKRILRFAPVTCDSLRIRILGAKASPAITGVGFYSDPFEGK